jgi:CBS domain-containing protein
MNVDQCMTRDPRSCRADDSLERAAQILWEQDCGCVPVLDDSSRVIGMITDRDICMAAYTRGVALRAIAVGSAMARDLAACRPSDSVESALRTMRRRQVRRMPVLDLEGALVGVLSFVDVARRLDSPARGIGSRLSTELVLSTLSGIGRPHVEIALRDGHVGGERISEREGNSPEPQALVPRLSATAPQHAR